MKEKSSLLIKLIIIAFIVSFFAMMIFYISSTKVSVVNLSDFKKVETSDSVKIKVKEISSDNFGNLNIKVLSMNQDIQYEYHNWTLGDGKGAYKNLQIAVIQDGKCYIAKTYPYGVVLSEEDYEEGFWDGDGSTCFMRNFKLDKEYQVAVIYSDREEQKYIIYQE